MAAQFNLMNVRLCRSLRLWSARAINSFPLPVSPKIRTVESVAASFRFGRPEDRDLVTSSPVAEHSAMNERVAIEIARCRIGTGDDEDSHFVRQGGGLRPSVHAVR